MPEISLLSSPKRTFSNLPQPSHPAFLWWRWQRSNFPRSVPWEDAHSYMEGGITVLCLRWEVEKQSFSISRALKSTLKGRVRDRPICIQSVLYSLSFSCVFFLSPLWTGLVKVFLSFSCQRWGCAMEGTSELEPGSPAEPLCSCVTLGKWLHFPQPVTAPANRDKDDIWGHWVREWVSGNRHSIRSQ